MLNKSFREIINDHITEKHALGVKYKKSEQILSRILNLYYAMGYSSPVLDKELVLKWAEKTPYETEINRHHRITPIRELAKYMLRMGYEAYIFPSRALPYPKQTYIPHIFTNQELAGFFSQVDQCKSTEYMPFRNIQLSVLFRLLYGSGLRISEALSLVKEDVDLNNGTIFIKDTKFCKERILPLSDSLAHRCRNYVTQMQRYSIWQQTPYFLPNSKGKKYDQRSIYGVFRDFLWKASISHGGKGKGPRLHDFRHTYAVHCLKNWVREGKDLTTALPYLSTYMGHVGVRSTQYYLRLTGELYPDIVLSVDKAFSWVIPEVDPSGKY